MLTILDGLWFEIGRMTAKSLVTLVFVAFCLVALAVVSLVEARQRRKVGKSRR